MGLCEENEEQEQERETMKTKIKTKKLAFVICRCTQAGVHAGELVSSKENGNGTATVVLRESRRLWYWAGAATLSELAVYGSKSPGSCRFPPKVDHIVVHDCCEMIYTQPAGEKMIREQPEWRA
jgi:hypothetical protein